MSTAMRRARVLGAACALSLARAVSAQTVSGHAASGHGEARSAGLALTASVPTASVPTASVPAALGHTAPAAGLGSSGRADPRLREVLYDPLKVVTLEVQRGVVTLIVLDPDETITEVASGQGSDCARPEAAWCVAVPPGGRTLFVKPKSRATAPNNLAVVTDRRTHAFRFVVLPSDSPALPVYRLIVRAAAHTSPASPAVSHHAWTSSSLAALAALAQLPITLPQPLPVAPPSTPAAQLVRERLSLKPTVVNARYAVAQARESQDIVPTLIFDDGRFTYLRFPGNRVLPAAFEVQADGSEVLVNARMEDDLLVVDRVARQLVLRSGTAAVGIWNEAFDGEGRPPVRGTTVPGVRRVLKPQQRDLAARDREEAAP